jgi:hypothetical protein
VSRTDSETQILEWRGYKLVRAPGFFAYKGALHIGDDILDFEVKPVKMGARGARTMQLPVGTERAFQATIGFNGHKLIVAMGLTETEALDNALGITATKLRAILGVLEGAAPIRIEGDPNNIKSSATSASPKTTQP